MKVYTRTFAMVAMFSIGACSSDYDSPDTPSSATASSDTSVIGSEVDGNTGVLVSDIHRCCVADRALLTYLSIIRGDGTNARYQIADDGAVGSANLVPTL